MGKKITQKSIVLVNFDPIIGHEQAGIRPAVIISGDSFHASRLCFVCPLTTKVKNFFGGVVLDSMPKNGLSEKSEVLLSQFRTISQERIIKKIGVITNKELSSIFSGLDLLMNR